MSGGPEMIAPGPRLASPAADGPSSWAPAAGRLLGGALLAEGLS